MGFRRGRVDPNRGWFKVNPGEIQAKVVGMDEVNRNERVEKRLEVHECGFTFKKSKLILF